MDAIELLSRLSIMMYDDEMTVNYDQGFLDVLSRETTMFLSTAITYHFVDDIVIFKTKLNLCGEECEAEFTFRPHLRSKTMDLDYYSLGNTRPSVRYEFYDSELLSVHLETQNFLSAFDTSKPYQFSVGMYKYSTEEEQDQFNLTLQGYGELIELYRNISNHKHRTLVNEKKQQQQDQYFSRYFD